MRFIFRLALALGKDVEEIMEYSSLRLQEWVCFYMQEPFGSSWHQTANILNQNYNMHRGKNPPTKIEDWLPVKQQQSADDMHNAFLAAVGDRIV